MSIFNFDFFEAYFASEIRTRRRQSKGLLGKLAQHIGVHPSLLSQVISASKQFTIEQALGVAEFFGLNQLESEYFLILVNIDRAGTKKLKAFYLEQQERLKKDALKLVNRVDTAKKLTELEKSIFYSSWSYATIHISCLLEKSLSPLQISERFNLPLFRVQEIIHFLIDQGLLKLDSEGKFQPGSTSTHLPKGSPHLIKHLTNWRLKALERVENVKDDELMYSTVVSLSVDDFNKLREGLVQHIQEFLKTVKDSPSHSMAQLNIDFLKI